MGPQIANSQIATFAEGKQIEKNLVRNIADLRFAELIWGPPTFGTNDGFIKGILRGVRCTKSLRVLFLHRRLPSWTTLVLYSRAVFLFNEPALRHVGRLHTCISFPLHWAPSKPLGQKLQPDPLPLLSLSFSSEMIQISEAEENCLRRLCKSSRSLLKKGVVAAAE